MLVHKQRTCTVGGSQKHTYSLWEAGHQQRSGQKVKSEMLSPALERWVKTLQLEKNKNKNKNCPVFLLFYGNVRLCLLVWSASPWTRARKGPALHPWSAARPGLSWAVSPTCWLRACLHLAKSGSLRHRSALCPPGASLAICVFLIPQTNHRRRSQGGRGRRKMSAFPRDLDKIMSRILLEDGPVEKCPFSPQMREGEGGGEREMES